MEYKKFDIDGYNLHIIKTKKFKTNVISVKFGGDFKKETVTLRSLLPSVLKSGTKNHPSKKLISKKLESLYGAGISETVSRYGRSHVISINMVVPNELFLTKEDSLFEKAAKFLNEVVFDPYLEGSKFDEDIVKSEKRLLKEAFESEYDNKIKYSINQLVKSMCKDELYSIKTIGIKEEIDNIDSSKLFDYYKDMLDKDRIDISVIGDIDFDKTKEIISKYFKFNKRKKELTVIDEETKVVEKTNIVNEKQDVNQGKLNIGYRTDVRIQDKDYFSMVLLNGILGSFSHSKLFQNVREKASLAYYAQSSYDSHKGVMFIYSGVEVENYQKAVDIIREQINAFKQGDISEEELILTKKQITNNLLEGLDSQISLIEKVYHYDLLNREFDIKKTIENVNNVTINDIVEVAQKIKEDTIFFLSNQEV